jgi:hypothetical protein
MFSHFASLAVVAFAVNAVFGQDLVVNTPLNAVVCRPLQITFSGGQSPWWLSAHPEGQPAAAAVVDFNGGNPIDSPPVIWTPNLAVGTGLFLRLRDSSGLNAESGAFTILNGSDTTCVGKADTSTPSSNSTASHSAAGSGTAAAGTTAAGTAAAGTGASATHASGSTSKSAAASASASKAATSGTASSGAATNFAPIAALALSAAAAALLL